jgi:hypothetical protein
MKNKIFISLIFSLCILAFAFASGCGKYIAQISPPVILTRSPVLGAGGVASTEALWLKFSKSMDTGGTSVTEILSKVKIGIDMTATATFDPSLTPEATWSESDTKLTITNVIFVPVPGNVVHIISSKESFQDTNGNFLGEGIDLWNYTLEAI